MGDQQNPAAKTNRENRGAGKSVRQAAWWAAALAVVGAVSVVAGFETARKTLATPIAQNGAEVRNVAQTVSSVRLPKTDKNTGAELAGLAPQQLAERLLEGAMQDDQHSLNQLREKVDGWRGQLRNTDQLFDLVLAAMNSADLRVRTAAVDVDLAANNLSKSPESVTQLLWQIQKDPAARGMALWRLGSLGNRGVEPDRVLESLLKYAGSLDEHTRYWAVEGLSMLGNDATLSPLLDRMAHDPSPRVRELAASSIGQAGMLTREERLAAVPHLLNFADDDSLNTTTRELVYGTLRVITGVALGNDVGAWRAWWAGHDPAKERKHGQTAIVRA